ncbi:MAG TPA: nuclear transport factor 2 family protein [Solirubrobacteraceae bacterium]|nr:nuclear transport factor 2 family protein [Solirubrobacteraceae bacterium]
MAHPNDELIERFYAAFARCDGDAMAECYGPTAHFSDPVFVDLHHDEPGAMWRMLTGRSRDLVVVLGEHEADSTEGRARWTADYTFSNGNKVHNDVLARFRFEGGLIVEHIDSFSFYAWSRQALGGVGRFLGWTPLIRTMVRGKAREGLDEFLGLPVVESRRRRRLRGLSKGE